MPSFSLHAYQVTLLSPIKTFYMQALDTYEQVTSAQASVHDQPQKPEALEPSLGALKRLCK